MKITPVYTLYEFEVPYVDYDVYMYFLEKFPELDVTDYSDTQGRLDIGISYCNKKVQEKRLKKLTKAIKKYYKD